MTLIPNDIENKIEQLFHSYTDRQEVQKLLLTLWTTSLNVGADQLARSILILSDGQLFEIKKIFASEFYGDPRNVIMSAEAKIGNPGHYFIQPFPDTQIIEPPDFIDGARVIKWAWSGQEPFGYVGDENDTEREVIYGLAICQYDDSGNIYRFSCDSNWETVQDGLYDKIENAIRQLPDQYKNVIANWHTK